MRLRVSARRLRQDVGRQKHLVIHWLRSRENDWLSSKASNRGVGVLLANDPFE